MVPLQVAVAHVSDEIAKADAPVRIIEVTCDVIRGRWRDRDASKRVERGHIRADEVQFQIRAAYLQRLLHGPPEMQFCRPILQSCVHLVWPVDQLKR